MLRGRMGIFNLNGGTLGGDPTRPSNVLAAHDIHSGKLKWQIGGLPGRHALPQPDTYFLGPPLPLMGQLYAVGEVQGEIRLLALEASTGELLWSQPLALAESNMYQDPYRRWAGASPSFSDGVLVCPTSTGAVVGVDLAGQSLLWGFCYGQSRGAGNRKFHDGSPYGQPSAEHWIDGGVCIENGRVLLTPLESDFIYCLNLADGKLLWKNPRESDLFVASVDREKVVLVGNRQVHAVALQDGKPAWEGRVVGLPVNSMPSGCGFSSGAKYFLPLSNAEVAVIDLAAGKLAHVSKLRDGSVPGNLICHQGKIISQGMDGVDAYFQVDAVADEVQKRLAANPKDAAAISLRGEILLDSDKRSEAVAEFRKAYELTPAPRTRRVAPRHALGRPAYGVRHVSNPERGNRAASGHIRTACRVSPLDRRRLAARREWTAAWESYQKLIELDPDRLPLDQIDKPHLVRRDRWIQSQLAGLRAESKDEAAAKIDDFVAKRLKAALASDSLETLAPVLQLLRQPARGRPRPQRTCAAVEERRKAAGG